MGSVINIRTRSLTWRMRGRQRSKNCVPLRRGQDGIFYFRLQVSDEEEVTWILYRHGEIEVEEAGVKLKVGRCLSKALVHHLQDGGHVYNPASRPKMAMPQSAKKAQGSELAKMQPRKAEHPKSVTRNPNH